MKTLTLVPALLLIAGCAAEVSPPAPASEEPAQVATPSQPTLSGKPTFVVGKDVEVVLEAPEVRHVGGRSFVVGRENPDSPYAQRRWNGGTVWVPLDTVTQMVELEPVDQQPEAQDHANPAER